MANPFKPRSRWDRTKQYVGEMIGKSDTLNTLFGSWSVWQSIAAKLTFDSSRVTYALTKAIFYASKIKGSDGKTYGEKYIYGAAYARPIVNALAAFVIGVTPTIDVDEKDQEKGDLINTWLTDYEGILYKFVRNGGRDGDSYLRILQDDYATPELLSGETVTKVFNKETGLLEGYDLTWIVGEASDDKQKIVEKYRINSPFYQVFDVKDDVETERQDATISGTGERLLPIIPLHNEQDANEMYGNSEFQNVYYYLQAYHAVFESFLKSVVYNNTSVPVITGIDNPDSFATSNGVKAKDGKYKFNWDPTKLLLLGGNADAKFLQTDAGAVTATEKALDKLQSLISIASETPEFMLGKEINSTYASVKQQMPVFMGKVRRKQKEYTPYFNLLVEYVMEVLNARCDYKLVWNDLMNDDMDNNIKIVELLSREGVITDKTKLVMLNALKFIADPDKEIEDARQEAIDKSEATDIYATPPASKLIEKEETPEDEPQQ